MAPFTTSFILLSLAHYLIWLIMAPWLFLFTARLSTLSMPSAVTKRVMSRTGCAGPESDRVWHTMATSLSHA
ncbi:hypothetical protein V8C44DRAFT_320709 [Trichoderma aethiopicum]